MNKTNLIPAALLLAVILAGCSTKPTITGSTSASTNKDPKRGAPVVAGRPARMYVMAGFREMDCSPLAPEVKVAAAPGKGDVSFKPNQMTTIQFSKSGQCVGQKVAGTGIYYTARKGQTGTDSFAITATAGRGAPMTKTFKVRIVD